MIDRDSYIEVRQINETMHTLERALATKYGKYVVFNKQKYD